MKEFRLGGVVLVWQGVSGWFLFDGKMTELKVKNVPVKVIKK